jgi:hypothetical protein
VTKFALASLALLLIAVAPSWSMLLADNGKAACDLVLSHDQASLGEKYGASELATFLRQITGAEFAVVPDDQAGPGPHIFVGDSAALRKAAPDIDLSGLGREGYMIKTSGPNLVLAGGRQRGSLYAVYGLLEDHLGCRWFTADCSRIPKHERLEVGPLSDRVLPPLEYREDFITEAFDGVWSARNRMNGQSHQLTPEMGDKVHYVLFVHTFYVLVPPDKYFKDHPEYFSLVDGRRTCDNAQLCLTNPDVVRIATESVRNFLRDAKARGLPDDVIISVSQNDCWGWCDCPNCKAIVEKEGSQSGPILHFINQVADNVKDEFPSATIDTLAYSYSRKPPKYVVPRPNVCVRLCSIECCFSHPLDGCPVNKTFMDDLRGWRDRCKRLYIWDYVIDFANYIMPFPNLRVLSPNVKTFVAHNVRGIFEEGGYPRGGGTEMAQLRAYMLAKILWNPNYDPNLAMNEFLDGYYGPAAPYVRQYIDLLHDTVRRENIHVFIWTSPSEKYLRPAILAKADALFDQAEKAVAADETLRYRVLQARMPVMYAHVAAFQPGYKRAGDKFVPRNSEDYSRQVTTFADLVKHFGVQYINEGQAIADWLSQRPKEFPTLDILALTTDRLRVEVVPGRGGRLTSLTIPGLAHDFMYSPPPTDTNYPVGPVAGYYDFNGDSWPGPGAMDGWQVARQSASSAVLAREADGFRYERTIEVDDASSALHITASATNISAQPREALLRLHPGFDLGPIDLAVVSFRTLGGKPMRLPLAKMPGGEPNIFYTGADMPDGYWRVDSPAAGVALSASFRPSEVSKCLLNFSRPERRINLELYSQKRTLQPGETLSVHYSWRVRPARAARPGQ